MRSIVTEVGPDAYFEGFDLVVLFGTKCPDELKGVCVLHEFQEEPEEEMLKVGGRIRLGEKEYTIEQVGDVANKNFRQLGHIMIAFSPEVEVMPGSILVSPYEVPVLKPGDEIIL